MILTLKAKSKGVFDLSFFFLAVKVFRLVGSVHLELRKGLKSSQDLPSSDITALRFKTT